MSALDPTALALGIKFGRYDLAHGHVRAALRAHVFGVTRSTATDVRRSRFRSATSTKGDGVVVGYASVFGNTYPIGGGIRERIASGAFGESIRARGGVVPTFYEHQWSDPIGAALVSEDAHGLRAEASLFVEESDRARVVWRAAKEGALTEWSVGYRPEEVVLDANENVETITRAELIEVSLVVRGANPAASTLEVRSA